VRTSRWTQACSGWRGDLAAYLVSALDPQACAAVRRHLSTCPACEAEYKNLVPVVSWLTLLTPPRPAPARSNPADSCPGFPTLQVNPN
jgi:anti-sigma factor RsiW